MWRIEHPAYLFFLLALIPAALLFNAFFAWRIQARNALGSSNWQSKTFRLNQKKWSVFTQWALICGLLVLTAADVRIGKGLSEVRNRQTVVMLALDVSASMLAEDTRPNRVAYAKRFLTQWIMQAPAQTRIGLMTFAGNTQIETPPTFDREYLLNRLAYLEPDQMIEQGTNLTLCIKNATKLLAAQELTPVLVLVTDAEDHSEAALEAITKAAEQGVAVLPIGVGTTQGAPVPSGSSGSAYLKDENGNLVRSLRNDALLEAMGKASSTKMYLIADGAQDVVAQINEVQAKFENGTLQTFRLQDYVSRYLFFLIPAIILLIWSMVRERN
jgi:Ca-activated chloride channel homolog